MNYIDHIKGYLSRAALLLLMAGGALMAGCEDFLVRDVPNQTTDEEWWQNKGQLNTALNNLYKPMPSGSITYVNHDVKQAQNTGYSNARVEMEALTDNGIGSANYVSYNAFTAGITSASETVCTNIWNMKWTVIRRCCRFMEHYQQATVAPDAAPHEGIQTVDRFAADGQFHCGDVVLLIVDTPLDRKREVRIVGLAFERFGYLAGRGRVLTLVLRIVVAACRKGERQTRGCQKQIFFHLALMFGRCEVLIL